MKIAVYQDQMGELRSFQDDWIHNDFIRNWNFIGYLDLPIEKPKRVVTKEAKMSCIKISGVEYQNSRIFDIPANAKNITCTYDIEE